MDIKSIGGANTLHINPAFDAENVTVRINDQRGATFNRAAVVAALAAPAPAPAPDPFTPGTRVVFTDPTGAGDSKAVHGMRGTVLKNDGLCIVVWQDNGVQIDVVRKRLAVVEPYVPTVGERVAITNTYFSRSARLAGHNNVRNPNLLGATGTVTHVYSDNTVAVHLNTRTDGYTDIIAPEVVPVCTVVMDAAGLDALGVGAEFWCWPNNNNNGIQHFTKNADGTYACVEQHATHIPACAMSFFPYIVTNEGAPIVDQITAAADAIYKLIIVDCYKSEVKSVLDAGIKAGIITLKN